MQKDKKNPPEKCPSCGGKLDSYYGEYKDDKYCVKSRCLSCGTEIKELYVYEKWEHDDDAIGCF